MLKGIQAATQVCHRQSFNEDFKSNYLLVSGCTDINECDDPSTCTPDEYCVNLEGSHECRSLFGDNAVLVFGGETYSAESSLLREHPLSRCDGIIPNTWFQFKLREVALVGSLVMACGGCNDRSGCNGLSRAIIVSIFSSFLIQEGVSGWTYLKLHLFGRPKLECPSREWILQ